VARHVDKSSPSRDTDEAWRRAEIFIANEIAGSQASLSPLKALFVE